jgi:hypothetical protein
VPDIFAPTSSKNRSINDLPASESISNFPLLVLDDHLGSGWYAEQEFFTEIVQHGMFPWEHCERY